MFLSEIMKNNILLDTFLKRNKMKKFVLMSLIALMFVGCSTSGDQGELVGVRKKSKPFYQPDPYGMVFVPMGSYTMGAGGQDIAGSNLSQPMTMSVSAFYMDETEITNNEYREFVNYVRDSLARTYLGEVDPDKYLITQNRKTGEVYDPPYLNWEEKIDWRSDNQEYRDALEQLYIPENERYYGKKEVDARKLVYHYSYIDLRAAAKKEFREGADYRQGAFANRPQGSSDRSQ